ncbi:transposase [Nonomuraea turcica]|uniref:transposase n=1 Tax=Nonomuraea sp. G32 TaxID=3067274 RepID=UPI00273B830E|nr:transposase [Nonomuraea sp. G32]MDP4511946.1 transposase [Nonomuraea sp. G32]
MPLYAHASVAVTPEEETGCSSVGCRFGHGAGHPARIRRYTTDMTDAEWQAIEPLMPWPTWLDGNSGRPEEYWRRQITDAIRYVVDNGCKWHVIADFPPWRTVHAIFTRWWQDGDLLALHNDLREKGRQAEGREAEPTAMINDSQSVRTAETIGAGREALRLGNRILVDCSLTGSIFSCQPAPARTLDDLQDQLEKPQRRDRRLLAFRIDASRP